MKTVEVRRYYDGLYGWNKSASCGCILARKYSKTIATNPELEKAFEKAFGESPKNNGWYKSIRRFDNHWGQKSDLENVKDMCKKLNLRLLEVKL